MAEVCLFDECFAVRCIFSQKGQKQASVHAVQRELFRLDRSEKRCVRWRAVPQKSVELAGHHLRSVGGLGASPTFKIIWQNKTLGHAKERELLRLDRSEKRCVRGRAAPQKKRGASRSPLRSVGDLGLRPHLR